LFINETISFNTSGLIPRWILEIATIVISNVLIHMLKSQLPSQSEMVPLYEYMAAVSLDYNFYADVRERLRMNEDLLMFRRNE
jgi:hypothetical protein